MRWIHATEFKCTTEKFHKKPYETENTALNLKKKIISDKNKILFDRCHFKIKINMEFKIKMKEKKQLKNKFEMK